jgi:hypothetical protein
VRTSFLTAVEDGYAGIPLPGFLDEGGYGKQSITTSSLFSILDLSKILLLIYALVLTSERLASNIA